MKSLRFSLSSGREVFGTRKATEEFSGTKKQSLEQLSEKTKLPVSQLKLFESDEEAPPIATLIKLAKGLEINVADLFQERPAAKSFEIFRQKERKTFQSSDPLESRYSYQPLTLPGENKHLDAYLIEIPPGQKKAEKNFTHPGEEFMFILEGGLKGEVGGEQFTLNEGDSLFLHSEVPHSFYNPHSTLARALSVIYPY